MLSMSDWEFEPKARLITRWGVFTRSSVSVLHDKRADPEGMRVHESTKPKRLPA